jgi:lipopolysaccharide/colanic/teichoic acid biosynthesis glycosyltransferase
MLKRVFDFLFSAVGLCILFPFFIFLALIIKLDSTGSVFFRQERVGLNGKVFHIHKFRTMTVSPVSQGLSITVGNDPRITRVGHLLRKYKIDELPQLIDVFLGDMSLVGPRPEVPFYVAHYPSNIRQIVLSVRPGITDNASIEFKDENMLLAKAIDPNEAYVKDILPIKLNFYVQYIQNQSFLGDIQIIFKTFKALLSR